MDFLSQFWMPIVVSAVFVWIASFLMHMVLPHHKGEYKGVPDEAKFNAGMQGVPPGHYMFPWGTMADMKSAEYQEKLNRGPVGMLSVWPGQFNMGQNLVLTLLFYLVVGVLIAYVASLTIPMDSEFMFKFRITAAAAFMSHGLGWMPHMIWFRHPGFWTNLFDSIVYAAVTGATFAWLWPAAAAA
jgi:hypothetical protein